MDVGPVQAAARQLRAAYEDLAALPVDALTAPEVLSVLDDLETLSCQLPTQWHRLLARLQIESTPKALGAKSWAQVLGTRWRISTKEATRRLTEAAVLGPRQSVTGPTLDPVLPAAAVAQSLGVINPEHVTELRAAYTKIPSFVDAPTRDAVEIDWVRHAVGCGPKELKDHARRAVFMMDQDGPMPTDADRARKRGVTVAPQAPDGMVALKAVLSPAGYAVVEAIFAKWAAPGMCNPADEHPCMSGTPTQAQIDGDDRSLAQRQHDALIAIGQWVLKSGDLGQHNGIATTVIVRTTLEDLESRAGIGVTGGGTLLPLRDVLNLAAAGSENYLAVFDGATGAALDLFRARRTASTAQKLMLIARDGGCTKPDCTVGGYGCQAHHAVRDWADDGNTNVDEMCLACGPDNRSVGPGGWTTGMSERHEAEWTPPPHLDTGQNRVNHYHRPEELLPLHDEGESDREWLDRLRDEHQMRLDAESKPEPEAEPEPEPLPPAEPEAEPEPETEPEVEPAAEDQPAPRHAACDEPAPDTTPVQQRPPSELRPSPQPDPDQHTAAESEATVEDRPQPEPAVCEAPEPLTDNVVEPTCSRDPDEPPQTGPTANEPGGPEPNVA